MSRNYNKEPLRIFIGVGHGGRDPGAVNEAFGLTEAAVNLSIAMLMQKDLRRHGVQVKLSRYTDEEDRLKEEIAECNAYAPDFAVEIHTNAGGGSGFEVYHQLEPWANSKISLQMATLFNASVAKYAGVKTRGLKTNPNLGWLKEITAPCILVENFFIDGPKAAWYCEPVQLEKLARAYTRAILEFYGIPWQNDGLVTLRYQMINEDLTTARTYGCQAVLVNGSYYVNLRQFAKSFGMAVYYEERTRKVLLYPPEYYTESEFQQGLLKISDFETPVEKVMAGISIDEAESWYFDEYNEEDGA